MQQDGGWGRLRATAFAALAIKQPGRRGCARDLCCWLVRRLRECRPPACLPVSPPTRLSSVAAAGTGSLFLLLFARHASYRALMV